MSYYPYYVDTCSFDSYAYNYGDRTCGSCLARNPVCKPCMTTEYNGAYGSLRCVNSSSPNSGSSGYYSGYSSSTGLKCFSSCDEFDKAMMNEGAVAALVITLVLLVASIIFPWFYKKYYAKPNKAPQQDEPAQTKYAPSEMGQVKVVYPPPQNQQAMPTMNNTNINADTNNGNGADVNGAPMATAPVVMPYAQYAQYTQPSFYPQQGQNMMPAPVQIINGQPMQIMNGQPMQMVQMVNGQPMQIINGGQMQVMPASGQQQMQYMASAPAGTQPQVVYMVVQAPKKSMPHGRNLFISGLVFALLGFLPGLFMSIYFPVMLSATGPIHFVGTLLLLIGGLMYLNATHADDRRKYGRMNFQAFMISALLFAMNLELVFLDHRTGAFCGVAMADRCSYYYYY